VVVAARQDEIYLARAIKVRRGFDAVAKEEVRAAVYLGRTAEQQAELLAVAYEGEYWRPTCASCGIKMVERPAKAGRAAFWGCANFRRCGAKPIWKAKPPVTS